MKKVKFILRSVVAIAICLAGVTMFSGCSNDDKDKGKTDDCGSVTLASLKKKAQDMGIYSEETSYHHAWDATDGFMIVYELPYGSTKHNLVMGFKDKAAADACAEKERKSGTKIVIQNCKFLTFASAIEGVLTYEQEKILLKNLMNGN